MHLIPMALITGRFSQRNTLVQEDLGYTNSWKVQGCQSLAECQWDASQWRRYLQKQFIRVFFNLHCFPVDLLESCLALPTPCKASFFQSVVDLHFLILMYVLIWPSSSNCFSIRSHSLFSVMFLVMFLFPYLKLFLPPVIIFFFMTFHVSHTVLLCYFTFPGQSSNCRQEKEVTQYKLNFPPFLPPHGPAPEPSRDDKRKNCI